MSYDFVRIGNLIVAKGVLLAIALERADLDDEDNDDCEVGVVLAGDGSRVCAMRGTRSACEQEFARVSEVLANMPATKTVE